MYFWAVKLNVLQGGTAGNKGQKRKWIWKWAMTRWRQTDSPCLSLLSYVCPKIAGRRCIVSKGLSLSVNHGVGSVLLILWDAVKQTPLHHLFYLCCTSSWRRNKRQTSAQWNHYLKTWEKRQWIRVAFALAVYRRCSFFCAHQMTNSTTLFIPPTAPVIHAVFRAWWCLPTVTMQNWHCSAGHAFSSRSLSSSRSSSSLASSQKKKK